MKALFGFAILTAVSALGFGACAHGTTLATGGAGGGGDDGEGVGPSTGANEVTSSATGKQSTASVTTGSLSGGPTTSAGPTTSVVSSSSGAMLVCGDHICSPQVGETCVTCMTDCSSMCCVVDGVCNTAGGETPQNCAADCQTTAGCNDPCVTGLAEDEFSCEATIYGACVDDVCSEDDYCCDMEWDDTCVLETQDSFNCACF